MRETNRQPSSGFKWWMVVAPAALVLIAGGVFWMARGNTATPDMTSTTTSTTAPILAVVPDDCPVTIPDGAFVPPDGYPTSRTDDKIWYGSDELWTVLSADGISDYQKSVWWSANFLAPGDESRPEVEVTFQLVGDDSESIVNNNATVARTPDEGSFINVGFQPDFQGCWEVTATYKGAGLTYVYYSAAGQTLKVEVPNLIGLTGEYASEAFIGSDLFVSFATDPGSVEATRRAMAREICAQSPRAGETVARGTVVIVAVPGDDGTCLDLSASIDVPDIVGLTLDLATERLQNVDLSSLIYGTSNGSNAVVCSQDPSGGTLVSPGQGVTIQVAAPGGCEEMLNPNGLYSRTYVDEAGFEWFGTDCPLADLLIRGGNGDGLPHAGDTAKERVDQLLEESGSDLVQPGVVSFQSLPRAGEVWDFAENGDVVVVEWEDDYMIKVTKDESFACPSAPYFWNGIPVAFINS